MKKHSDSASWIWGRHSLIACLENYPDLILEIMAEQPDGEVESAAKKAGLKVQKVNALPRDLAEKRTQGIAARLKSFPVEEFDIDAEALQGAGKQFALLDSIEDPRNFGAILRSAAAFGVAAVFITERRQSPITGVVAQASAGNVFRIPIISCSSFNRVLDWLESQQGQLCGLEGGGRDLHQVLSESGKNRGPLMWAVGSEGRGLRPGLLEKCHHRVRIPMESGVESLNASVAASIAFYATHQKLMMR